MRFLPELGFNIMALGRWNPSILTPQWLKENVVRDDSVDVLLAISMNDPSAPPRLSFQNIQIFPSRLHLDVRPTEFTEDAFVKAGSVVETLLKLLPHTPISAIGLNYRFVEKTEALQIAELFNFSDAGRIPADSYIFKAQFALSSDRLT